MIAATAPALPFPRVAVRPDTSTHQRQSSSPHRLHFHPIFNILSKIRTLGQDSRRDRFIFINLRALGEKNVPLDCCIGGLPASNLLNIKALFPLSTCSHISNALNQMWTLCHFLQPTLFVFSILWTLLAKTPGVGGSMTNLYQPKTKHPQKEKAPDRLGGGDPGLGG